MKACDRFFKRCSRESHAHLNFTKHHDFKKVQDVVSSKNKESKMQYYENFFLKDSDNGKKNLGRGKNSRDTKGKNQSFSERINIKRTLHYITNIGICKTTSLCDKPGMHSINYMQ